MKPPVNASHWVGVVTTLNALATPGIGPALMMSPLLRIMGELLTNLRRVIS